MSSKFLNRRRLLQLGLFGLSSNITLSAFGANKCPLALPKDAKALKKLLRPDSKTSKRLKFVSNAVDSKTRKGDGSCGGCKFYKLSKAVEGHAPCSFAGNKYVPSCGYCKQFKLSKSRAKS